MRKFLIILLIIIFNSNSSLANNKGKVTLEEIENIFFVFADFDQLDKDYEIWSEKSKKESYKKRSKSRGIANCAYNSNAVGSDQYKQCLAKIVRVTFGRSERFQKKRPGDVFYALSAIEKLISDSGKYESFVKTFMIDMTVTSGNYESKKRPGMRCDKEFRGSMVCRAFKKSTYKKIEKFKLNPSNEKVLGHKLIKYVESIRMINSFREIVGVNINTYNFIKREKYELLGDMLNDVVKDVKKTEVSPSLLKRRVLLKRYSSKLRDIKKKLERGRYKSIDKDVLKLSKIYAKLKLSTGRNEKNINIDEAINVIFDINKLIQNSVLNAENNKEENLLAIASIDFTQFLIETILTVIPEKYFVETKELTSDLFEDYDLDELQNIINSITEHRLKKTAELTKNRHIIDKYINTSEILNELNKLGIKNKINTNVTINDVYKDANKYIEDNFDNQILKDVKKIVKEMNRDELDNITKEISAIASEVSSDKSIKKRATSSYPDPKFGGQSLKRLIAISRR